MLENKKSKKESSDTMKVIFLGWMYHCKKCGKTRGIMKHNHKDYSHKRYQELTDKYKKELECAKRGITLLSSFVKEKRICPRCKKSEV